jgi:hypothetical protein
MSNQLTDQQKNDICGVIGIGCDRDTAAKYAHTTWADLHAAMHSDPDFAARVRHEEAVIEIKHMTQIRIASKKEANWRISVWWLERLAPDQYGPRGSGDVSARQLKKFIEHVGATLVNDVHNDDDRKRLLTRLQSTADTLELFLRDDFQPDESLVDEPRLEVANLGVASVASLDDSAAGSDEELA